MKSLLFRIHQVLGVAAALILAVVGATGALLSFKDDVLAYANPGVITIPASSARLSPGDLLERLHRAHPELKIASLSVPANPARAAVVGLVPEAGERHGKTVYVDPSAARLLGEARGLSVFATIENLHRRLGGGEAGKQVVGAATLVLIVLVVGGLPLRMLAGDRVRHWFWPASGRHGMNSVWNWHAVLGLWCAALLISCSVTGLYWSYGWWREGLFTLAGVTPSERPAAVSSAPPMPASRTLDLAWSAAQRAAPDAAVISLRLPANAQAAFDFTVRAADARHGRAVDRLQISRAGQLIRYDRFADQALGEQMMASMLALHSGTWFGRPGQWAVALASLGLSLLALTGLALAVARAWRRRAGARARQALAAAAQACPTLVAFASQSGRAEAWASETALALHERGEAVRLLPLEKLDAQTLAQASRALFVVATAGEGEAPDHARAFVRSTMASPSSLAGLRFQVLALGDRSYTRFAAFGQALRDWLLASAAHEEADMIMVDGEDARALARWRARFGVRQDDAGEWTLVEREHLNPGSQGSAVYRLRLQAQDALDWRAGDIASVRVPGHSGAPECSRDYSVASLPSHGGLDLVVRQVFCEDGRLGRGSGWLSCGLAVGEGVRLSIRSNRRFHGVGDGRAAIYVGNGSGIGALRAHLQERIAAGHHENWLVFGERQRAVDNHFGAELADWQALGRLARCDLVFSRDGEGYVQDRLDQQAERLREWVARGASVYVCGDAAGMAAGVDAALARALGEAGLARLVAEGRLRRDVY